MSNRYTLSDAAHFLTQYETVKKMFEGIDDQYCAIACNKFARMYNSAIKSLEPLPMLPESNAKPATNEDTELAIEVMTNMAIAEEHANQN